jgi:hypothetical protein
MLAWQEEEGREGGKKGGREAAAMVGDVMRELCDFEF